MKRHLHSGFEPEWGWWVSADLIRRVYSSFSLDEALINWESLQAATPPKLKERESLDA